MYKLQNVFLILLLSIACCSNNLKASMKFDGLQIADPQAFATWAQECLAAYHNELCKYEHVEDLAGQLGVGNAEVLALKHCHHTIEKIERSLIDLKLRNADDCYQVLKDRYNPVPLLGDACFKVIETTPFGKANYQAYCQGLEAVANLPRVESKQINKLLDQAEGLGFRYNIIINGHPKGLLP